MLCTFCTFLHGLGSVISDVLHFSTCEKAATLSSERSLGISKDTWPPNDHLWKKVHLESYTVLSPPLMYMVYQQLGIFYSDISRI